MFRKTQIGLLSGKLQYPLCPLATARMPPGGEDTVLEPTRGSNEKGIRKRVADSCRRSKWTWRTGKIWLSEWNDEGESILDTARVYDLVITNTFFWQKEEHLLTFRSRIHSSVIDYTLVRRESLRNLENNKVIPGDPIATQHRLLVMEGDPFNCSIEA